MELFVRSVLLFAAMGCNHVYGIGGSPIILHNAAPMPIAVALVQFDPKENALSTSVEYPNKLLKGWVSIGMIAPETSVSMLRPYYKKDLDTLLIYSYGYDQLVSAVHSQKKPEQFFKIGQVRNRELFIVEDQKTGNLTVQKSVKGVDLSWVKKDNLPSPSSSQSYQVGGERAPSVMPEQPSRGVKQAAQPIDWDDVNNKLLQVPLEDDDTAQKFAQKMTAQLGDSSIKVLVQNNQIIMKPAPQAPVLAQLKKINTQLQQKTAVKKSPTTKSTSKPRSPQKQAKVTLQKQEEAAPQNNPQGNDPRVLSENIKWNQVKIVLSKIKNVQGKTAANVAELIKSNLGKNVPFLQVFEQEGEIVLQPAPQDGEIVQQLERINQALKSGQR